MPPQKEMDISIFGQRIFAFLKIVYPVSACIFKLFWYKLLPLILINVTWKRNPIDVGYRYLFLSLSGIIRMQELAMTQCVLFPSTWSCQSVHRLGSRKKSQNEGWWKWIGQACPIGMSRIECRWFNIGLRFSPWRPIKLAKEMAESGENRRTIPTIFPFSFLQKSFSLAHYSSDRENSWER